MSWSASVSYSNFLYCKSKNYRRLYFLLKIYVFSRDRLLLRLRKKFNILLPKRTPKNTFLLEHILSLLPEEAVTEREEILNLIRFREKIAGCLYPYYRKIARKRLITRLGEQHVGFIDDYRIDIAIYKGTIRSLDRMQKSKIGLRIDFVIAYIDRAIAKIAEDIERLVPIRFEYKYEEEKEKAWV